MSSSGDKLVQSSIAVADAGRFPAPLTAKRPTPRGAGRFVLAITADSYAYAREASAVMPGLSLLMGITSFYPDRSEVRPVAGEFSDLRKRYHAAWVTSTD